MKPTALNPILNVSDFRQSVAWFNKLGWEESWSWSDPPTFGAVCAGQCEIFLCQGGQGGRGDKGVWLSIWVDDVDEVHRFCVEQRVEVISPPADREWNVREMQVRHPDGHVFRIGTRLRRDVRG